MQLLPGCRKEDRHQYATRSAHHRCQPFACQLQQLRGVVEWQFALLQQMDNFPRPFGERRAGIAIAHFSIQRIQAVFEIDKRPRRRRDQRFYLRIFRRFDFQLVVNGAVALSFHWRKRHRFLPADGLYIGINGFLKCLVQT